MKKNKIIFILPTILLLVNLFSLYNTSDIKSYANNKKSDDINNENKFEFNLSAYGGTVRIHGEPYVLGASWLGTNPPTYDGSRYGLPVGGVSQITRIPDDNFYSVNGKSDAYNSKHVVKKIGDKYRTEITTPTYGGDIIEIVYDDLDFVPSFFNHSSLTPNSRQLILTINNDKEIIKSVDRGSGSDYLVDNIPTGDGWIQIGGIKYNTEIAFALNENGNIAFWGNDRSYIYSGIDFGSSEPSNKNYNVLTPEAFDGEIPIEIFVTNSTSEQNFITLAALTNAGNVWTWGDNNWKQLGLEHETDSSYFAKSPSKVNLPGDRKIKQVIPLYMAFTVLTTDNKLFNWGYTYLGQLGIRILGSAIGIPVTETFLPNNEIPVKIGRYVDNFQTALYMNYNYFGSASGKLYVVGGGSGMKLGNGSTTTYSSYTLPFDFEKPEYLYKNDNFVLERDIIFTSVMGYEYDIIDDDGFNTNIARKYNIKYRVSKNGKTSYESVYVLEVKPIPTILNRINIFKGDTFDINEHIDFDINNYSITFLSGNLNSDVLGIYTLVYRIEERSNNNNFWEQSIDVIVNPIPQIDNIINIFIGDQFDIYDYIDFDKNDFTIILLDSGNFDPDREGNYHLEYEIKALRGNGHWIQTVNVIVHTAPKIDNVINLYIGDIFDVYNYFEFSRDSFEIVLSSGNFDLDVAGNYTLEYKIVEKTTNKQWTQTVNLIVKQIPKFSDNINIFIGDDFDILNYSEFDINDYNITLLSGNLDTGSVGIYQLEYKIEEKDSNRFWNQLANVNVKEIPFLINNIKIYVNDDFDIDDYIEFDTNDYNLILISGNFDNSVIGIYQLEYKIEEISGNRYWNHLINLNVIDIPKISYNITITEGEDFNIYNYVEFDINEYNIVLLSGNINVEEIGEYQLEYKIEKIGSNRFWNQEVYVEVITNSKLLTIIFSSIAITTLSITALTIFKISGRNKTKLN